MGTGPVLQRPASWQLPMELGVTNQPGHGEHLGQGFQLTKRTRRSSARLLDRLPQRMAVVPHGRPFGEQGSILCGLARVGELTLQVSRAGNSGKSLTSPSVSSSRWANGIPSKTQSGPGARITAPCCPPVDPDRGQLLAPPQPHGQHPAYPPPQQGPVPLHPHPVQPLHPVLDLSPPVELVPGIGAGRKGQPVPADQIDLQL